MNFSSSNPNLRAMGRFITQSLLGGNTWSKRYSIPENDRYSYSSTEATLVSLNFPVESYGIYLFYNQIDTDHGGMWCNSFTITHSVN